MSGESINVVVNPITLQVVPDNTNINVTPQGINLNVSVAPIPVVGDVTNGALLYSNNGIISGTPNAAVVNGNVTFSSVGNLKIAGGVTSYFLQTDGSGNLTWAHGTGNITGNGTSAGANNQIQLSNGTGGFRSGSGFNFDTTSNILTAPGNGTFVGNVSANYFFGNGSQLTGIGQATFIANGTSNVNITTANGNVTTSVGGTANVLSVSGNSITVTGNIYTSGLSANISGANVITANTFTATGNITANGVTANGVTSNNINVTNVTANGNVSLGSNTNVHITGGSNGQYLKTNGSGNLSWSSIPSNTEIVNGSSNVSIPVINGNITVSAGGNAWTFDTSGNITIPGGGKLVNVLGGGLGNISQLRAANGFAGAGTVSVNQQGYVTVYNAGAFGVQYEAIYIGSGDPTFGNSWSFGRNGANYNIGTVGTGIHNAYLGNLVQANYVQGTLTTAAQPNITSLGTLSVSTLKINGGTNGYVLQTDGAGNLSWTAGGGGGGNGTPGGSNTQVQYNDSGLFAGTTAFTFNSTSNLLSVTSISADGGNLSNITGANVSGTVANATYATNAGISASANSVAGANVIGTVANATYATTTGNVNFATRAGTVTTSAQPNITSVGTLTSLNVGGVLTSITTSGQIRANGNIISNAGITGSDLWVSGTTGTGSNAGLLKLGTWTTANARAHPGFSGAVISISDNGGLPAYWNTTVSRWNYIYNNSAV